MKIVLALLAVISLGGCIVVSLGSSNVFQELIAAVLFLSFCVCIAGGYIAGAIHESVSSAIADAWNRTEVRQKSIDDKLAQYLPMIATYTGAAAKSLHQVEK
jgi:hypothetical protein